MEGPRELPSHGWSLSWNGEVWTQLGLLARRPVLHGVFKIVGLLTRQFKALVKSILREAVGSCVALPEWGLPVHVSKPHSYLGLWGQVLPFLSLSQFVNPSLRQILHFFLTSASFVRQPLASSERAREDSYLLWQSILRNAVKTKGKHSSLQSKECDCVCVCVYV